MAAFVRRKMDGFHSLSSGGTEIRTKRYSPVLLHSFFNFEAAAIVSALIGHWEDFAIITSLLLFNAGLEFWQNRKASSALAALKKGLAPEAAVLRDGEWQTLQASSLVPGDIVKIRLGAIVPADLRLVSGNYVSIDQAALTGESLPATKKPGDQAYSGSIVKQGEMVGVVIATGPNTFFGRSRSVRPFSSRAPTRKIVSSPPRLPRSSKTAMPSTRR